MFFRLFLLPALLLAPCLQAKWSASALQTLGEAGATADDNDRQKALEKLASEKSLSAVERAEAVALADFTRRWNESALKFYGSSMRDKPPRAWGDYDFQVAEGSPLRPVAEFFRGRMLAWTLIENSSIRTHAEDSRWFKDEAVKSFQRVFEAFPDNAVARMYLGQPLPWLQHAPTVAGAPEWATLQREQTARLRTIILWWIENRQQSDGQFRGGWGDDCEMWRWWAPVLLGFDDPRITASQLKFSKAALKRPHLKDGFNTEINDVEHAAEDTTDNLVPLMVLEPDEPRWTQWGLRLGTFMDGVWTGQNERGQRQFKSFYFSATATAPQPHRAMDVLADVGALHPALLAWQKTGDEAMGKRLCEWLDTWVDATARTEMGKPAGILPAAIHWPSGNVSSEGQNWWEPVKPGGYMHSYYLWPSVITELTDALMLAYVMTGKEPYLQPLRSMADIRLRHLKSPPSEVPAPGSEAWCAEQLAPRTNANSNTGGLVKSLARLQALTGSQEFNELLALESAEFVIRTEGDGMRQMEAALRESLAALRVNFPGFTSEVRSTDRVMRFVQFLAKDYAFDAYKGVNQPKHELLYRMITGDKNAPRFPLPAVRWITPPKDIAALVTRASTRQFQADLFHFGSQPRLIEAELRLLKPGNYRARLLANGEPLPMKNNTFTVVQGRFSRHPFELPPQQAVTLEIMPAE